MNAQRVVGSFDRVVQHVEVDAVRLRAYMDGPLVKPLLDEYLRDFREPRRRAAAAAGRVRKGGPRFRAVYRHIQGPRAYARFTESEPDKSGWADLDHEGSLLFRLLGNAQESEEGLYRERHCATTEATMADEDEWMARRLWYIGRRLVWESKLRARSAAGEKQGTYFSFPQICACPHVLSKDAEVLEERGAGDPSQIRDPGDKYATSFTPVNDPRA